MAENQVRKTVCLKANYKNAKSENMMILECINNKSLDMPIYYDLEDNSQTKLGKTKLTEIAELFCETIKKSGYNINDYKDGYAGAYNCYIDRLQLILS